ncbi:MULTISPECIES: aminopeptidase P family protein [Cyanophyceae]|uniref:aminopeptidase P family protein n=1 Tax=Cyanophyceae TaxID=3028117 RepID=UPI0016835E0C|nr:MULTISPECIES: aminopeptidase P family protein [Cyanophyceae]MBD1915392.1 aminopeptidase P family protein [Phormidium sp. FACHB-77]MBD2032393.1 aminopeptidase P family protein [Phormidium sp. FACHB-322]MBD2052564.1 aminopeptidase P family protein [Leptolyngbya sp. FACHB-60]
MPPQTTSLSLAAALRQRRDRLAELHPGPVVLWSGQAVSRNFPANTYPFRANSHFLYFAGLPLANAALHLEGGRLTLFMNDTSPEAALWHGPSPSREAIAAAIGADAAYPCQDLDSYLAEAATLPAQTAAGPECSRVLAAALVTLRLHHDDYALDQIKQAVAVSVAAHKAGMASTLGATTEAQVRAAMEQVIIGQGMTCAYNSIVTVHGEVLHNEQYHHALAPGDLLLADVGAEAPSGWASDITRTWPVSGQFTAAQRDIYNLVLAAHDACIAAARPGIEYRDLHLLACRTLTAGLVDLGVLKGDPDALVERDVHALFFPHGVGHLLGLDVHDMEDLGDMAGYAPGRSRSDRFGLKFLRLDRPLAANMVVTIEPGFYQVPGILGPARQSGRYDDAINWNRLKTFDGVRGIRIENDVHINSTGCIVLTAALPTRADAVEALVSGA